MGKLFGSINHTLPSYFCCNIELKQPFFLSEKKLSSLAKITKFSSLKETTLPFLTVKIVHSAKFSLRSQFNVFCEFLLACTVYVIHI